MGLLLFSFFQGKLQAEEVKKIDYGKHEAISYVASRFPSVYGVIYRVLSEVKRRLPDYSPRTMLDYGTGPGTGIWAAHHVFQDNIREFTGVDLSEHMLNTAEDLIYGLTFSLFVVCVTLM
jgi:ribosomal protein RSM22 (predicted rRNA methylase)